jgi:hypothetical protein
VRELRGEEGGRDREAFLVLEWNVREVLGGVCEVLGGVREGGGRG